MAHFVRIVAIGHSALNHESQATTRAYVHTIAVKKDKHSNRIGPPRQAAEDRILE